MNRDNVLWALAGLLLGFVSAYLLFETVGSRQPPRAVHGGVATAGAPPAPAGPAPGDADRAATLTRQAQEIEQFLATSPEVPEAWLQLANTRFDLQRFAAAAEAYNRYLELAPADPDVITDLGVSYRMMGRQQEALEQFRRARGMAPDHWKSLFNEVVVLAIDQQRFDEANDALDRLRELQPDNPDVARLAAEVERRRDAA